MYSPTLFAPPPTYILPLSWGGDLIVHFQYNPSGDGITFVDWPVGTAITMVIDYQETVEDAVITGSDAQVTIPADVVNLVPPDTRWRLLVDYTTVDEIVVAANGRTGRFDG